MRTVYNLWKIQVLRNEDFLTVPTSPMSLDLDPIQTSVVNMIKSFLRLRTRYYNEPTYDELSHPTNLNDINWTKIISITGKAGTGKTKCLHASIDYAIENELKSLVATPTGFLASIYCAQFDEDLDANTVHSSFLIPTDGSSPQINWALAIYDLIIIDDVSMVSAQYFEHIISTLQQLPTRPIMVISGDKYQLPPLISTNNCTTSMTNVYQFPTFSNIANSFNLTQQHRCIDKDYENILEHIRFWKPTLDMLKKLHNERLLHHSRNIDDNTLLAIIKEHPSSTFLTVSRNAVSRINSLILQHLFATGLYLGTVQMDNKETPCDIFKGMRVILTQNRDKRNGIVNGQPGIIMTMSARTVLIKLPNAKVVSVYPVSAMITEQQDDGTEKSHIKTCYPFVPGYAITIFKSQGQTLENVVLWFDTDRLGEGAAYVALSRVKSFQNIKFLTPLQMSHFQPVRL